MLYVWLNVLLMLAYMTNSIVRKVGAIDFLISGPTRDFENLYV